MSDALQRDALATCRDILEDGDWILRNDPASVHNKLMTMRLVLLDVVNVLLSDERAILHFADVDARKGSTQPSE